MTVGLDEKRKRQADAEEKFDAFLNEHGLTIVDTGRWEPALGAVFILEDVYVGPHAVDTVRLPKEHGGIHVPVLDWAIRSDGSYIFHLAHESPNAVISNGVECLWVNIHKEEEEE